jgi:hypothetical protein
LKGKMTSRGASSNKNTTGDGACVSLQAECTRQQERKEQACMPANNERLARFVAPNVINLKNAILCARLNSISSCANLHDVPTQLVQPED